MIQTAPIAPPLSAFKFLRVLLAAALLTAAVGAFSEPSAAAVFGRDERQPLPKQDAKLADKIGTLASTRNGTFCTAFCVAPDLIATASHCLYGTATAAGPDIKDLTFKLGRASAQSSAGVALASAGKSAAGRAIVAGTTRLRVTPPIAAEQDWAVARLATPACTAGALALSTKSPAEVDTAAESGAIYQIAVHADLPDTDLRRASSCAVRASFEKADRPAIMRDFANADAILFHTCDTGGGSSGSPLLIDTPDGPEVIAINVGTYVLSRAVPTARDAEAERKTELVSEPIANTAVAIRAIRSAIENLEKAVSRKTRPD